MEQEFHHQRFLNGAGKLDKEGLVEIADIVHTNYLIRNEMFRKLVRHCVAKGYELPAFSELFKHRSVDE